MSRLKSNANPRVVDLPRAVRGNSRPVAGERAQDVIPRFKRQVLDGTVRLAFRRRSYGGSRRGDDLVVRMVAILNQESGDYHTYLTNIGPRSSRRRR